jgi:hypothetical protein
MLWLKECEVIYKRLSYLFPRASNIFNDDLIVLNDIFCRIVSFADLDQGSKMSQF